MKTRLVMFALALLFLLTGCPAKVPDVAPSTTQTPSTATQGDPAQPVPVAPAPQEAPAASADAGS